MSIKEALYAPLGDIKSRRGRGGTYDYVTWKNVVDRMNDVFGINWSSELVQHIDTDKGIVVRVRVLVTDPDTGKVQFQEGYGGDMNDAGSEVGNAFKSAYSKALKDACKKWGVALYLEDDSPTESTAIPPGYMGKEVGVPPSVPEASSTPPAPPVNTTTPELPKFVPEPQVEAPVNTPTIPTGGMPLPPGVSMGAGNEVQSSVKIVQEAVDVNATPTAPPVPPGVSTQAVPPVPPQKVTLKDDMPMSKVTTINTGEPDTISDVQKAALQSILNMKGVDYIELAKEAFEANGVSSEVIPEPDKLTYQEAVYVVKYGNDKFRKR
jgi:hypothetical protein